MLVCVSAVEDGTGRDTYISLDKVGKPEGIRYQQCHAMPNLF